MADYDLTRLGTTEFEHLAQALAVKHLGPGVRVYGAGRDGGREATVTRPTGASTWPGDTVMQAKFRARPGAPGENADWLRNEIRKELNAWTDTDRPRSPKPDNLLFVTNVVLSAVPGHGVDHVLGIAANHQDKLPLQRFDVWHYDQLCRLLDDSVDIRTAYAGLITPGDVLAELRRILTGQAADLGEVMRRHAAKELLAEQWVRLGQAGSKTNERLPLGRVAVDLPAERSDGDLTMRVSAVRHVLECGDRILRPSAIAEHQPHMRSSSPHMVLVGGPGQGKTTLAQLMCQAYRIALLDTADDLGEDVTRTVAALREALDAAGISVPAHRRWPLRIDLSNWADEQTSLLRYIASRVSARADETVSAAQIKAWLKSWPSLLVLDGLDEVAAPPAREALVSRVADFLVDVSGDDMDVLIVATTRPRGYAGEFRPERYDHLTLTELTREAALGYASRLADARHGDDPDMRAHVLSRIREAADEELTSRLMQTPLQVTIMSLLLESRARIPQHRHGLFDAYYETIYARETAKSTPAAKLLETHRRTVDALHDRVGLTLQIRAETDGHTELGLPQDDVRELVLARLTTDEYEPVAAAELADKLVKAATDRLVLLVPKNDNDVGFEVRSLQEFMAARALVSGDEHTVLERLRNAAPSSHWRNTWLLAAGRIAARQEHMIDQLLKVVADLDAEDFLAMQLAPGADLAADLLDDGFAATSPKTERLLLKQAVELLRRPVDTASVTAADVLQRVSIEGSSAGSRVIADVATKSLGGQPPEKITAAIAFRRWANRTGHLATVGRQRVPTLEQAIGDVHRAALTMHFIGFTTTPADPLPHRANAGTLADWLPDTASVEPPDRSAIDALREQLRRIRVEAIPANDGGRVAVVRHLRTPDQHVLDNALSRSPVAELYAQALLDVVPTDWAVASALTAIARQWLEHRPVGIDPPA